jgi:hypothetical protein
MRSPCCLCFCAIHHQHFSLCIHCRGNIFTKLLPSNGYLFWIRCSRFKVSCDTSFKSCLSLFSLQSFSYHVQKRNDGIVPSTYFCVVRFMRGYSPVSTQAIAGYTLNAQRC